MKVVLLAGGLGSRLGRGDYSDTKADGRGRRKPIILHVMDIYSHWGFHDFVVAGGYKCMSIKAFFHNFHLTNADFTVAPRQRIDDVAAHQAARLECFGRRHGSSDHDRRALAAAARLA